MNPVTWIQGKFHYFNLIISSYRKDQNASLPHERTFRVPNIDKVTEDGKKAPKFRTIKLHSVGVELPIDLYTPSGWPSVSGDALKILAGKVSADFDFVDDSQESEFEDDKEDDYEAAIDVSIKEELEKPKDVDLSAYGKAFTAFTKAKSEEEGREACHAIAALCEVCSIDSLISNFILPLQVILLPYHTLVHISPPLLGCYRLFVGRLYIGFKHDEHSIFKT